MPKIAYADDKFNPTHLDTIQKANTLIASYQAQGYSLTLRQLYYQFVARGWLANTFRNYKNLGTLLGRARMAGLVDWNAIEDRTRNLRSLSHWDSPASIIESAARSYHRDLWETQSMRVEVWIEKDALVGVIEGVCNRFDLPHFSCRGYGSLSEMWSAARRLANYRDSAGSRQDVTIIHLGDHDPSGIDMTRDIQDRLNTFGARTTVTRIALNMDQIDQYQPPPNPVKDTDSRSGDYHSNFGGECWELDALEPRVITELIETEVKAHLDADLWANAKAEQERERRDLTAISANYEDVVAYLNERED